MRREAFNDPWRFHLGVRSPCGRTATMTSRETFIQSQVIGRGRCPIARHREDRGGQQNRSNRRSLFHAYPPFFPRSESTRRRRTVPYVVAARVNRITPCGGMVADLETAS
jgi:hypothetical protein